MTSVHCALRACVRVRVRACCLRFVAVFACFFWLQSSIAPEPQNAGGPGAPASMVSIQAGVDMCGIQCHNQLERVHAPERERES